jgi:hypothetical protein
MFTPDNLYPRPYLWNEITYICICNTKLSFIPCFIDRCSSFCNFSFGHCVVCSSSIYEFGLPLWYLQTLLKRNFKNIYYYCGRSWVRFTNGYSTQYFLVRMKMDCLVVKMCPMRATYISVDIIINLYFSYRILCAIPIRESNPRSAAIGAR